MQIGATYLKTKTSTQPCVSLLTLEFRSFFVLANSHGTEFSYIA